MNRTATLIASLTIVGLSACTAQQRHMIDNVVDNDHQVNVAVVTCDPVSDVTCAPGPAAVIKTPPTVIYDPVQLGPGCDRATLENCS